KDVRATLAMMRTPDGQGIELDKFHTPDAIRFGPVAAPVNTLGFRRVMFAVDDIDAGRPAGRYGRRRVSRGAAPLNALPRRAGGVRAPVSDEPPDVSLRLVGDSRKRAQARPPLPEPARRRWRSRYSTPLAHCWRG